MRRFISLVSLGTSALALSFASGCGGDEQSTTGTGGGHAVACDAHESGAAHFTDKTVEWGLGGAEGPIDGVLLVAGDLDGDGYPDLIAHVPSPNTREVIGAEPHYLRVLMNVPRPGGGRMFVDRTFESGYGQTRDGSATEYRSAGSAAIADVDNDGDPDLFSGTFTFSDQVKSPPTGADMDRNEILLNDGQGHFTLAPLSAIHTTKTTTIGGASFVDLDRDGLIDVFAGTWYGKTTGGVAGQLLYKGHGDGTFDDISVSSGVTVNKRPVFGTTACDLDDDGVPELLASAYGREANVLYRSDAPLHYTDVGPAAGYSYDDNNDYHDDQAYLCYCVTHMADPYCAGAAAPKVNCSGVPLWLPGYSDKPEHLGGNTFSTLCSDIDGDGDLDLFNGEIAHWWAGQASDKPGLLLNASDASGIHFQRPDRDALGLSVPHTSASWDEGWLYPAGEDMDNDARQDVIVGATDYGDQYGLYFHQRADGTFEEIAKASGFDHPCAGALAIADFDRDGDLDIVTGSNRYNQCANIWPSNELHFFENDSTDLGHYVIVKLKGDGVTTNAMGIGARVTVDAGGVKLLKELGGGYGHQTMQHDTVLFFGVGACAVLAGITVVWPNAARTTEVWHDVPAGRMIELRQGDSAVYDITPQQ